MATEGRAQRMDKDCPHTLQLLLCGQLRAVSLPFFLPFVALRDAGSEVPSYSLGSCIRCDLCTPTNKGSEVKKHWNLHDQTWMLRRVHVTCIAMMQGSVPSLHAQPWLAFSLLLPIKMSSHCDKRATQEQWKTQRARLACDVLGTQSESCVRVGFPP